MIVTDENGVVYREGDTIITTSAPLELFFSDGSVSILEANSSITLNTLNFKGGNNLNTLVKLALGAGTIWIKATNLNDDSAFEIYTTDSTAAVRGTIFGVSTDGTGYTDTIVIQGVVEVTNNTTTSTGSLTDNENIRISAETESTSTITPTVPVFSKNTSIRDAETEIAVLRTLDEIIDTPQVEDIPEELCEGDISEWNFTTPILDTTKNAYLKKQCIKTNGILELSADIFDSCIDNYSRNGTNNSCILTNDSCSIGDLTGGTKIWNGTAYGSCTYIITDFTPNNGTQWKTNYNLNTTNYKVKLNNNDITLSNGKSYGNTIYFTYYNPGIFLTNSTGNIYSDYNTTLNKIEIIEN